MSFVFCLESSRSVLQTIFFPIGPMQKTNKKNAMSYHFIKLIDFFCFCALEQLMITNIPGYCQVWPRCIWV